MSVLACCCITTRWHFLPVLGCCRGTHLNAVVWHVWRFLTLIKADAFGVSMLHCCHKLCLRLKECLSPLSLSLCNDDDSHSNTPCRNLLPCYRQRARERENKRKKRERCVPLCGSNRVPVHPFMCATCFLCVLGKIPVLISIPTGFPKEMHVFAPLSLFDMYLNNFSLICNLSFTFTQRI